MLLKEWQNLVIEHVSSCDGCFCGIELCKGNFAVSINKCLLIDTPDTLEIANIKGVLLSQITRMSRFYLSTGLIIVLFLFKSSDLSIIEDNTVIGNLLLKSL